MGKKMQSRERETLDVSELPRIHGVLERKKFTLSEGDLRNFIIKKQNG